MREKLETQAPAVESKVPTKTSDVEEILRSGYLAILKDPVDLATLEIRKGMIEDNYEIFLGDRIDFITPSQFQGLMERGTFENWIGTSIDRLKAGIYRRQWIYDAKWKFKEEHWTLRRMLEAALPSKDYLFEVGEALEAAQKVYPTFNPADITIAQYRLMNRVLRNFIISHMKESQEVKKDSGVAARKRAGGGPAEHTE